MKLEVHDLEGCKCQAWHQSHATQAQAVQHFPPLDKDAVEVPCQDTCGNHYTLRYIACSAAKLKDPVAANMIVQTRCRFHSWINNQSRMYLLEGTQDIQVCVHAQIITISY